jgi:hypothetical protein
LVKIDIVCVEALETVLDTGAYRDRVDRAAVAIPADALAGDLGRHDPVGAPSGLVEPVADEGLGRALIGGIA